MPILSTVIGCVAALAALSLSAPGHAADDLLADSSERQRLNDLLDSISPPPTVRIPAEVKEMAAPSPLQVPPPPRVRLRPAVVRVVTGEASWYGPGFYGNRTANGEVYRPGTMTAAHRTLPFGTKVRVTNLWNGRMAVIRINDRGPFVDHRVIDLGHGAASHLGLTASGIAEVKLEVLR